MSINTQKPNMNTQRPKTGKVINRVNLDKLSQEHSTPDVQYIVD